MVKSTYKLTNLRCQSILNPCRASPNLRYILLVVFTIRQLRECRQGEGIGIMHTRVEGHVTRSGARGEWGGVGAPLTPTKIF